MAFFIVSDKTERVSNLVNAAGIIKLWSDVNQFESSIIQILLRIAVHMVGVQFDQIERAIFVPQCITEIK